MHIHTQTHAHTHAYTHIHTHIHRSRLQSVKSILTSYATARKAICEKALENAQVGGLASDMPVAFASMLGLFCLYTRSLLTLVCGPQNLCAAVEALDPEADYRQWLDRSLTKPPLNHEQNNLKLTTGSGSTGAHSEKFCLYCITHTHTHTHNMFSHTHTIC
jgi:hypothetical protein